MCLALTLQENMINGAILMWRLFPTTLRATAFLTLKLIANPTLKIDSRISPLTYRSEDFDETDLFIKKIVKTGVPIV
ncbi:hypothetical protein EPICR_220019 [Candidatus Desulfarcum epimagneticum]|uniref:Uncharacterized protein n=1 Tax=uncultured Desulfobacteraceae bacterium TaxID=218296 RepID=A0A484HFN9_9BACT|nr:hypothetical protein EPICR_220019 [uncultured Desulfobacteraceae bacterium]